MRSSICHAGSHGPKKRLVAWALIILALPFVGTGAVIMGGHFGHYTTTVNWAWCAVAGVGLPVLWLAAQRRKGRMTA